MMSMWPAGEEVRVGERCCYIFQDTRCTEYASARNPWGLCVLHTKQFREGVPYTRGRVASDPFGTNPENWA